MHAQAVVRLAAQLGATLIALGLATSCNQEPPQAQGASAAMPENQNWLMSLAERNHSAVYEEPLAELSGPMQVFRAVYRLESDVNSDGFESFFLRTDSATIRFTSTALREIGANECAALVDQAISTLGKPLPDAVKAREELVDSLPESVLDKLDALDERFYAYPNDLSSLLAAFARKHPTDFRSR